MAIDIKLLKQALQELDLSDEVIETLQNALKESADLDDLMDQLPMDILAQIQSLITPAAGEKTNLHGRMQDSDAFKVLITDIKTGMDKNSNNPMTSDSQIAMTGPLENNLFDIFTISQNNFYNPENFNFSSLIPDQILFIKFFDNQTSDPFQIEFRTVDGYGNNTNNLSAGSTGTVFSTISGYQYGDGFSTPNDTDRPNARDISNEIFAQTGDIYNHYGASNFLWVWGQFLDHDIDLTREGHSESYAINAPIGDVYFDPYYTGTQTISFTRSGYLDGTGDAAGNPRLQVNEITAFIDASNVYGSTAAVQALVRGEGGTLLTSAGDLLPIKYGDHGPEFQAGDVRANENVGLTSMHTLFVREHNYWVQWLKNKNPDYTDDQLFNTAKAIVEAEIQHITYDEFLPALLGDNALPNYQGYNPNIDPQIATEFATAAFRVGHTMLSSDIYRLQENGDESAFGHLTLQGAFFRPDIIMTQGGIDEIIRGLGSTYSQAIDATIIDDVRNFLFGPPGAGGFDLVSLNIQRGRDHGIPDFNSVRESYGLEPLTDFSELTSDPALITKLIALYGDISHLDLWVGGLLESPYGDAMIGETFFTIIADQFTRLRDGDRFWYEGRFDEDFLDIIHQTSLSDIILRNSDIDYLQNDIFTVQNRIGGDNDDNILIGTDKGDLLIGFDGDDTLNGGAGQDTLYGGAGHDIFIFDILDGNVDTIRDFNVAEDKIDISTLLDLFDPLVDAIADFVNFTQNSGNLVVSVDRDGNDTVFTFEDVVTVENVNPDDPYGLVIL